MDAFDPTPLTRQIRLADREIADRLVVLGFAQQDAELLESLRPWAVGVVDAFLGHLYDEQFSHADFVRIVENAGSDRERLLEFQRQYVLGLFSGMPDAAYVESRLRIGALHARIGVTPRWYVSSYGLYEKYLFPMLRRHFAFRRGRARRAVAALSKLLNFDKALVLDMYIEGLTEDLHHGAIGASVFDVGVSQAEGLLRSVRNSDPPWRFNH